MYGPDYDETDFDRLASFVSANRIRFTAFTILTPLPGTISYRQIRDQIQIKDLSYYNLLNSVLPTKLPPPVFYQRTAELYKLRIERKMPNVVQ